MVGYQDLNGNIYIKVVAGLFVKVAKYNLLIDIPALSRSNILPTGERGIPALFYPVSTLYENVVAQVTSWQITEPFLEGKIVLPTMTQTFPINKKFVPAICETLKLKGIYGS